MIGRLIEIDKEARARVAKAKKERAKALETVDQSRKAMDDDYAQKLENLIEQEKNRAAAEKAAALSEVEEKKQTLISGLDRLYEAQSDAWVDAIVARVLE